LRIAKASVPDSWFESLLIHDTLAVAHGDSTSAAFALLGITHTHMAALELDVYELASAPRRRVDVVRLSDVDALPKVVPLTAYVKDDHPRHGEVMREARKFVLVVR